MPAYLLLLLLLLLMMTTMKMDVGGHDGPDGPGGLDKLVADHCLQQWIFPHRCPLDAGRGRTRP